MGKSGLAAGKQILIKSRIEGGEATAEEKAAVVAAAGEHGGIIIRQVLPASFVSEFPENGIEQFAGINGRAAAPTDGVRRRKQWSEYMPLAGGKERIGGIRKGSAKRFLEGE